MNLGILTDIKVKTDSTDHIAFFCPECDKMLKVIKVKTFGGFGKRTKRSEQCTFIDLRCEKCNLDGQRKFYWADDFIGIGLR